MSTRHRAVDPHDIPFLQGATTIDSFQEVKEILRSPLFKQGGHSTSARYFIGDTVVMLDGAAHARRRRLEARLFTDRSLARFREDALLPVVRRTLRDLADHADVDGVVRTDLVALSWSMLYRISARVVGIDDVDTVDKMERFIGQIRAIGEALTVEFSIRPADEVIEAGRLAHQVWLEEFLVSSAQRRRKLVAEVAEGALSADALPTDLLTLLYSNWEEEWDEELPIREATLFVVGSVQTTAQALPQLIIHLEGWFREHPGDRRLLHDDPDFLPRAAAESLRFFLAAPARVRIAIEDTVLESSGRKVAAGERVALLFRPANTDPDMFGLDADQFNPFRTTTEVPWGLAFSSGQHTCPGKPMVTGIGPRGSQYGTMVTIARALYDLGLELDSEREVSIDETTHYEAYTTLPIRLTPAGRSQDWRD